MPTPYAAPEFARFGLYHANKRADGKALRLSPAPGRFKGTPPRWKRPGLYLELADQAGPMEPSGGAPFAWEEAAAFMLGERDIAALLLGVECTKWGVPIPAALQPPNGQGPTTVSLVHKDRQGSSGALRALRWQLGQVWPCESSVSMVDADLKRAFRMDMLETFQFAETLRAAAEWFRAQEPPRLIDG